MQQNNLVKAIAAAAFGGAMLVAGTSAFADEANLTVKGTITPSACIPSFSGGGTVDFGTIKTGDLKADGYTKLGTKTVNLTIQCQTAKNAYFEIQDNQKTSALGTDVQSTLGVSGSEFVYGMGTTMIDDKQVNLGSYALSVDSKPTVDGASADDLGWERGGTNYQGGAKWLDNGKGTWYAAVRRTQVLWGLLPDNIDQYSAKTWVYPITVTAAINKGSLLPINEDVTLNGQATFTIQYQ
jgi:type 1 fimbria pilin